MTKRTSNMKTRHINGHTIEEDIIEKKKKGEWGIAEISCSCPDCGEKASLSEKFVESATDREIKIATKWMYGQFVNVDCRNMDK